MNLIRSLMGRRQFLLAAGLTSTSALAYNKLADMIDPVFKQGIAEASEKNAASDVKGVSNRYSHLLSPLKIRNVILKNRMMYTLSDPHFLQGPETYPSDVTRAYYATIAKSAAIVTCRFTSEGPSRKDLSGDSAHMNSYDLSDPAVHNYIDQAIEGIHSMGSLASTIGIAGLGGPGGPGSGAGSTIKEIIAQAKLLEDKGGDIFGVSVDIRNKESVRNAIERIQAVKSATNLIIMLSTLVIYPSTRPETEQSSVSNHITLDEAIAMVKTFEGFADMLFFKASAGMNNHPTGFNQEKGKPLAIRIAQAIKESGSKMIVAANGGFFNPDENDEFIASGKTDIVAMSRPFISNPEYGKNVYDGKGEDIVPCIMCNKCHGLSMQGPWYSVCSVNPKLGVESAIKVLQPPAMSKKVAVIGGGPAGMKAAITAAGRGHKVSLYEKASSLGGLLCHTDYSSFKWPLKDYKDYLIHQVKKAGIEVFLNTEATPDKIKAKGYDVVLAAVGAEPNIPKIPGVDGKSVWNIVNVYGREKELGKNVVFIGGGEFGAETAMYLAQSGHSVTVLTSEKELVQNNRVHYPEQIIDAYEHMDNFNFFTEATVSRISNGKVIYTDAKGAEKSIQADSVVIYAGLKPKQDEALKFSGSAGKAFYAVGDCTGKGGNLQRTIRSAYFMASQL